MSGPSTGNTCRLIPAYWLGGMATHGLLIGAAAGTWIFARWHRLSFLRLADALVIPGAFLMGVGRIGNFIDGQIVGSLTDVPWAVKFPDAEGFRHPVVLYDGLKNLTLDPIPDRGAEPTAPPGCCRRPVRVLVRIPPHLRRSFPQLPHSPTGAGHRPDPEHRHDPGRGCVAGTIALAPTRPPAVERCTRGANRDTRHPAVGRPARRVHYRTAVLSDDAE